MLGENQRGQVQSEHWCLSQGVSVFLTWGLFSLSVGAGNHPRLQKFPQVFESDQPSHSSGSQWARALVLRVWAQSSSCSITWEPVRNAGRQAPPKTCCGGPVVCLNKPCRGFSCSLRRELG